MDSHAMFLNCPAYMDKDGGTRCGLPAEVEYRYTMNSTDGPLESAKISCPRRHHFKTITPPIWANYPLALLFPSAWAGIQLQMTSPPHTPTCPPMRHSPPTASRKPAPATT